MTGEHTIVLVQFNPHAGSRTYIDCENLNIAVDEVVKFFEQTLKQRNKSAKNITYDIEELFQYVDSLTDLSALVFNRRTNTYMPFGKEWIKEQVFKTLQRQATK